jgi:sugar lactone lactonase YvrE
MRYLVLVLVALAVAGVGGSQAATDKGGHPDTIRLPDGFQPEGIAIAGNTFYVGSIPTGAVYRGSLRSGAGALLVPGGPGKAAIGVEVDRGRLFVAGGPTGKAFVYSARSGAELATYQLTTATTFINDVVVTRSAAWFTDSFNQVLYRVALGRGGRLGGQSAVQTIPITGDLVYTTGFNVNGIDATRDGKVLVVVQSNTGKLFRVTRSGVTRELDLGGGSVPNGDGILLDGRRLYVVQNQLNQIARIAVDRRLRSGRILGLITDPDFDVPTTIDDHGKRLYAVNARFGTPPTPTTRYDVVQVRK